MPHAAALDPAVLDRFSTAFLPDVSDAVGQLYTMDASIRPIYQPMRRLVGQALTIKAPPGDNLTVHGALSLVQPNDVLVIDWRGTDACATGAGSLALPIEAGLRGAVVDGGWRDVEELRALEFPVFSRTISAFSPPKLRPGEINVPVHCGGVVVHPGDVVVADVEGVCIVPRAFATRVAESLREYQPHRSASEWDRRVLERARDERAARWREIVTEHGGDPDGFSPHGGST
jgi:4-hydroxy-4-methyl-2-oxoglutarate aldolase